MTWRGSREHPVDVIFPVLHGPFGEDGSVQGLAHWSMCPRASAQDRRAAAEGETTEYERCCYGGGDDPASCLQLVAHAGHDNAVVNLGIRRTFDVQNAEEAALRPSQRVIDKGVIARH